MSEKYYVVSESELNNVVQQAYVFAISDSELYGVADEEELNQAEAACRARPVPEWATHLAREPILSGDSMVWKAVETKK